jgi:hypothetical protein
MALSFDLKVELNDPAARIAILSGLKLWRILFFFSFRAGFAMKLNLSVLY